MKKINIIIALLLAGNLVMAQTSVWHGGREMWTRGEGTEESPFLIESADQLAMLSYAVNKGYNMPGLYFKLTTDIDLNGSEDQLWTPIGTPYYPEDGCDRKEKHPEEVCFRGNFDGGGHAISNIHVDAKNYAGLFGRVYPYDCDTTVLKNIRIVSGYVSGLFAGGIAGDVENKVIVSDCYNAAEIHSSSRAGGISGCASFIERCYNMGKVSSEGSAGGIASMGNLGWIKQCYNTGEIIAESEIAGGIVGFSMKTIEIENCYNTGTVSVLATDVSRGGCGGIMGCAVADRFSLHNCYNVGSINGMDGYTGGVFGGVMRSGINQDTVSNCYYLNTCGAQGEGIAMDEGAMRAPGFVDMLNDHTDVWAMDTENHNSGFPILMGLDMGVEELKGTGLAVYPNPTQGTLQIESSQIEEIVVFNMLGVMVLQKSAHALGTTATIDVSSLVDGVYLLRVVDAQHGYQTCPFVVRH